MEVKGLGFAIIFVLFFTGCVKQSEKQFYSIPSSTSGITFNNTIEELEDVNILKYEYVYNGGGVAIADLNGDNLQDIVFTGNMVDNAIYLNQGKMKFQDVSKVSGILSAKRWNTGVTIVDVNYDGLPDIYICASGHDKIKDKSNLLFVHQGNDEQGIPRFTEMAAQYGIADTSNSTMAAFFDYDNDNDLDLIVVANVMPHDRSPSTYRKKIKDGSSNTDDHLYENKWNEELGHPVYTEVSEKAGILIEGYSLGLNIADINEDGWKDIYITNDYLSNDLLYINNHDGTFTDRASEYFKHTSFSAMGNDVIDMDNDGHSEIIALDMLPEDNYRRKTMLPALKYSDHFNNEKFDFQYQFVRNTLQKNNFGPYTSEGKPSFSDVAFMSGIAATDWSWAPLVADFDNDTNKDLIITNGFPKDVTDRDFVNYINEVRRYASDKLLLEQIPEAKLKNYAYRNIGNLKFENVSSDWGIEQESFSNGAAYGDLDNDGDLDYVVNNINDAAFLFENTNALQNNWIRLKLVGPQHNPIGFGSIVQLFYDSTSYQQLDYTTVRGYLSSHEPYIHFGLNKSKDIDSIKVFWQDGKISKLPATSSNQIVEIKYQDALSNNKNPFQQQPSIFNEVSEEVQLELIHREEDFIDFSIQPLLIHKLSQFGPSLSVGDLNSDGLEDLLISGSHYYHSLIYHQNENGTFTKSDSLINDREKDAISEELGAVIFDADGDGDNDIYITHGGNEFPITDPQYVDLLYENKNGKFVPNHDALPALFSSTQCVRAADFDNDGDLDLFVGARVAPQEFPKPVSGYILRNDSKPNSISFSDVTEEVAPGLLNIGMITDGLWTDFNNDGSLDLILSGEFMPVTFFQNINGSFKNITSGTGISNQIGWWNSLTAGDYDHDGDIDYIAGNQGTNFVTHVSDEHPLRAYYNDFDKNGSYDLITTCYFPDPQGSYKEYTYYGSSEVVKQYNEIRKKFQFHKEFALITINELFTQEEMEGTYILAANNFNSSYIENLGNNKFRISPLPDVVQRAPVFGMLTDDVNNDGNEDVVMVGNDYGTEVSLGRLDAHDGLIGLGDGKGNFHFLTGHQTGFFVQEDAKALVKLYNDSSKKLLYVASQNRGPLKIFKTNDTSSVIEILDNETYGIITSIDGKKTRKEFYFGNGFLSQSSRKLKWNTSFDRIEIYNTLGNKRTFTKENLSD